MASKLNFFKSSDEKTTPAYGQDDGIERGVSYSSENGRVDDDGEGEGEGPDDLHRGMKPRQLSKSLSSSVQHATTIANMRFVQI